MVLDGKYSYVLTGTDYKIGGFVDINVNDFLIDSKNIAIDIKKKLENYAREHGDNTTEFIIEEF